MSETGVKDADNQSLSNRQRLLRRKTSHEKSSAKLRFHKHSINRKRDFSTWLRFLNIFL